MVARLRVSRSSPGYDDAVGEGLVALTQAANSYDARKGAAFTTWAWPRVSGAVKDWMTAQNRPVPALELDEVEEPARAPAEFDPESDVEARLAEAMSEASPALARAATRAMGMLLGCEFEVRPGANVHKDRRRRAAMALRHVRRVAGHERSL